MTYDSQDLAAASENLEAYLNAKNSDGNSYQ